MKVRELMKSGDSRTVVGSGRLCGLVVMVACSAEQGQ